MNTFRLIFFHLRLGIMSEMQYRVNFFVQLFQSFVALMVGVVSLLLVFSYTSSLAGWSRYELLAVMGIHILTGGFIRTLIQPNMEELMGNIQEGTFDFALTKPADAQVLISVRQFRVWQLVDVVLGFAVLLFAAYQMQLTLGVWQSLSFVIALLCGAVMIYTFWLLLTTVAFWAVRIDTMINLFQGVYAAGRYPVGIYPDWLRTGLTFLVPVAFAVTVPAEALTQRLTPQVLLGAIVFAIFLLIVSRLFWRRGLQQYGGASA
jgi:ABC-2 type transport system permease protein